MTSDERLAAIEARLTGIESALSQVVTGTELLTADLLYQKFQRKSRNWLATFASLGGDLIRKALKGRVAP